MTRKILTMTALPAAMLFFASAAHAQAPAGEVRSVIVTAHGIDLNSDEGQQILKARVRRAVNSVCPSVYERDLRLQAKARECRMQATSGANEELARLAQRQHLASLSAQTLSQR